MIVQMPPVPSFIPYPICIPPYLFPHLETICWKRLSAIYNTLCLIYRPSALCHPFRVSLNGFEMNLTTWDKETKSWSRFCASWLTFSWLLFFGFSCLKKYVRSASDLEDLQLVLDDSLSFRRRKLLLKVFSKQLDCIVLHYLTEEKNVKNSLKCKDSVANFHIGNGATLHNFFCPFARTGSKLTPAVTTRTWDNSLGFMANYLYDLNKLPNNSETYRTHGSIDVNLDLLDRIKLS